ncbi:FabD/lysophospholipase-like protein [Hypoxylon sp. FL0543]|nr:FabD/lysophospholipase-like protein [Hypoxylon sp. FL0543]
MARNDGTPVNLLALDGGGIRGICELRVLDEIMKRIQKVQNLSSLPRPCDYFHLMAGTSTGGLVAILLSRFKMTTTDAIAAYYDFSGRIFSKKNKKYRKSFFVGHEFGEAVLEQIIKDMVVTHKIGDLMLDPEPLAQSKAFVCSQQAHEQGIPVRFRTYEPPEIAADPSPSVPSLAGSCSPTPSSSTSPSPSPSPSPPSSSTADVPLVGSLSKAGDITPTTAVVGDPWNQYRDIKIWEAARATTAAPSFFPPMVVSRGDSTMTFIDGAMGCNNPVYELIDEATALFGTDCVLGCLVSLGTGFAGPLTIGVRKGIRQKLDLLLNVKKMATDTENFHKILRRQIRAELETYFRFQLPSGAEKIGLHQYKKLDKLSELMQAYIEQESAEIDKVVQILVGNVKPRGILLGQIARSDHGQICPPKRDIRCRPPVSEFFTGRGDVLYRLSEAFRPDPKEPNRKRHHLLYGQPGAGKSQTASKFLDDYGHWFEMILWVDAMSAETLEAGFKELKGGCSEYGYVGDGSARSLIRWLEVTERSWILVLDDVRGDVSSYVPRGNKGAVLFTSQNKHMMPVQKSTTMVDVMSEADAVDLILSGAQLEEEDAKMREEAVKLAAQLEYLPLALESAATTLRMQRYKVSEYAKLLEDSRNNLLKNKPGSDEPPVVLQAVRASFDVTYKVLNTQAHNSSNETKSKAARYALQLLSLFSFYHNEGLMGGILKRAVENRPEDRRQDELGVGAESFADLLATDDSGKWIESRWQLGVDLLIAYSLVKVTKDSQNRNTYSIHGLIHEWARERMPEYIRSAQAKAARLIVFDSISESQTADDIQYNYRILQHAWAANANTQDMEIDDLHLADQYYRWGLAMGAAENTGQSLAFLLEAYGCWVAHHGVFTEKSVTMGERTADAAFRQGLGAGTIDFALSIFRVRECMYGLTHISTVRSLLRVCMMSLEYDNSDGALEKTLRSYLDEVFPELCPGEDQSPTETALSVLLYHSGRLDEARDIMTDVVQKSHARLGSSHLDTLKSINNLAIILTRLGDYEEAEDMLQRLMRAEDDLLGSWHLGRAYTMHNLAAVYFYQERFEDALELFLEARDLASSLTQKSGRGTATEFYYHHQATALVKYHLGYRKKAITGISQCARLFGGTLGREHIFTKEAERQRDAWIEERERGLLEIQTPIISRIIPMFRLR